MKLGEISITQENAATEVSAPPLGISTFPQDNAATGNSPSLLGISTPYEEHVSAGNGIPPLGVSQHLHNVMSVPQDQDNPIEMNIKGCHSENFDDNYVMVSTEDSVIVDKEFAEQEIMRMHSLKKCSIKLDKQKIKEALKFRNTNSIRKSLHNKVHSNEKPYQCLLCSKTFSRSENLDQHMRSHTGDRPFKCPLCSKSFTQSGNMETHKRIHSGEKPFKCPLCPKSFSHSGNMERHKKIHTGERPFKCPQCPKSFTQSGNI